MFFQFTAIHPHSHHGDDAHSHEHNHHDHSHDEHGEHSHGHNMSIGLWVLGGIMTFLTVEKLVRLMKGGHGHSHGPAPPKKEAAKEKSVADKGDKKKSTKKADAKCEETEEKEIEVSGYLNLAADFTHNFTDG